MEEQRLLVASLIECPRLKKKKKKERKALRWMRYGLVATGS